MLSKADKEARKSYRKFFSIEEIENSRTLQWFFGALIVAYLVTFFQWIESRKFTYNSVVDNTFLCWPHYQDCAWSHVLKVMPLGYSMDIFYLLIFGVMILIVYFLKQRDFVLAHLLCLLLFIWQVLVMFVFTYTLKANFYYHIIIFSFVFLLLPYKLSFLRLSLVIIYFLASTVKLHEGWVLGTYFTSLQAGIPLFSNDLVPLITNGVIIMQIVGSWYLLSSNKVLHRSAFWYFVAFHMYSISIVRYEYPVLVFVPFLVLFSEFKGNFRIPDLKKGQVGYLFILFLICIQFTPYLIKGEHRLTLEGNYHAVDYMFEANHQCISSASYLAKNGTEIGSYYAESFHATNRCDPYWGWFWIQQKCNRNTDIDTVQWTFDHSINGGPFYRIVDAKNACQLDYKPFTHNEWIQLPEEGAKVVGRASKKRTLKWKAQIQHALF